MADDRKTEEPFLQRWARRKADAAKPTAEQAASETAGVDATTIETAALPQTPEARPEDKRGEPEEIDLSALPDIDSLDADSDFSVFMRNGIPEALQKRALQKLWRLDPAFSHIDGLLEYGEDFTGSGLAAETVKTIYKVGKGMLTDADEEAESATAAGEDAEEPVDAAEPETAVAGDRPAIAQADQTENTDGPESDAADVVEPDPAAQRCDRHRER